MKKEQKVSSKKSHWFGVLKLFREQLGDMKVKIVVEGLEDTSDYYHPKIVMKNGILEGQCDLSNNGIYGWRYCTNGSEGIHITVGDVLDFIREYEERDKLAMSVFQEANELLNIRNDIDKAIDLLYSTAYNTRVGEYKAKVSKQKRANVLEALCIRLRENDL